MEQKSNKSTKIILILLILAILCIAGYLGYKYEYIKIPDFIKKIVNKDEKKESEEEQSITDQALIDNLSSKVNSLSTSYRAGKYVIEDLYENSTVKELTSDEKKIIAMRRTANTKLGVNDEIAKAVNGVSRYVNINGRVSVGQTLTFKEKNSYVDNYYQLFNERLTEEEKESNWDVRENCAVYYYISDINKFMYKNNCNIISSVGKNLLYKEKYTTLNDRAYVYVRVGLITQDSSYLTVYGDNSRKKVVKEKITKEEMNQYNIDQNNYTSFASYRFVFKKNKETNNYYFSSVEKNK